jgi:hypothetical protein
MPSPVSKRAIVISLALLAIGPAPRDSSALTGPVPCRPADLTTRLFFQGATSSVLGGFKVRNKSAHPCSLGGRPAVHVFHLRGGRVAVRQEPARMPDGYRRVRVLRHLQEATVPLQWWNYCGANPAGFFRFAVTLTGGATVAAGERGSPTCLSKSTPSTLEVSKFGRVLN